MNLERLKDYVGDYVKNYKVLCEILGEPILSGPSKMAQLKEWARWFLFEQEKGSQKYWIREIYSEPKPKVDGRSKGNRRLYADYVRELVVRALENNSEGDSKTLPIRDWLCEIGFVNDLFLSDLRESLANAIYPHSENTIEVFLFYVRSEGAQKFKDGINLLRKENIIVFEEFIQITQGMQKRQATSEEEAYLRDVQKQVLDRLQCGNNFAVPAKILTSKFYRIQKSIIKKERPELENCGKVWKISKGVQFDEYKDEMQEVETVALQERVGELFGGFLKRLYENKQEKRPKEVKLAKVGKDFIDDKYAIYHNLLACDVNVLIDMFISRGEKNKPYIEREQKLREDILNRKTKNQELRRKYK